MEDTSDEYKRNFSNNLQKLYDLRDWLKAKKILIAELKKYPEEYYLMIELARTLYMLNEISEALLYASKANEIEPQDALVNYHYGYILYENKMPVEAIVQFDKILCADIEDLAYGDYGEGLKYAQTKINDARYFKALCLIELNKNGEAELLLKLHLQSRKRGLYSDFTKKQVTKKLNALLSIR